MIDVITPAIKQDLKMLDKSIDSVRKYVIDGINDIYVISPNDSEIKSFCDKKGVIMIDEIDVVGFAKNDFNIGNNSRNGWLYQQLIKLNGDKIAKTDNFLVIDSDHVLLKPHIFFDGKYHFYTSNDYHEPYFRAIEKLFNGKYKKEINKCFIIDKMIFNKNMLSSMKNEIELINKDTWTNSIIKSYFKGSFSGFSEYETYGTYFTNKNKMFELHDGLTYMSFNKSIEDMNISELSEKYNNYMSITEHKYAK